MGCPRVRRRFANGLPKAAAGRRVGDAGASMMSSREWARMSEMEFAIGFGFCREKDLATLDHQDQAPIRIRTPRGGNASRLFS